MKGGNIIERSCDGFGACCLNRRMILLVVHSHFIERTRYFLLKYKSSVFCEAEISDGK